MAKKNEANETAPESEPTVTPTVGVNTPPLKNSDVDTSVDSSTANFGASDFDMNETLREQNKELARNASIHVERDDEGGLTKVTSTATAGINPSSTYPGRDMELAENDMRIPTVIDLAKRAKFAGSQIPEIVHSAGLVDESGEITVDVPEDSAADTQSEDSTANNG